jgi:hypothetical protein
MASDDTNTNVIYLANRIAARVAEHEEGVKKHDEWLEQRWQATLIYSRAIKEMRALGLDKPAVVRLLRAAIDVLEGNDDDR